jgi:hypothetical protein
MSKASVAFELPATSLRPSGETRPGGIILSRKVLFLSRFPESQPQHFLIYK